MELITSAPITSARSAAPLATNCVPAARAKLKPLHAADRSNPRARLAPIWSWTRHAVAGKLMSGVTVATTMRSMSSAVIPRRRSAS